jgi:ribokinase
VPRVLVVGSANVDYTVQAPRLPQPGETVSDGSLFVNHGGKGANQALAACRLGAEVRLLAAVGDDAAGRGLCEDLAAAGVDVTRVVLTTRAATGTALIVVDSNGRNQIVVAPGANRTLDVEQASARSEDFAWAQVVMCQLEIPLATARWVLEAARSRGATTILNPAPLPDTELDFLGSVDYLTPNAGEAERLAGARVDDPESAAKAAAILRSRGVGTVIITLGEGGALALTVDRMLHLPAVSVDVVDTTAAGDAFNGALAVAVGDGQPLVRALRFANAAAALACTRRGAQASLPTREEVERLLGR